MGLAPEDNIDAQLNEDLDELEDWIQSYADAGRPLKTVEFRDCHIEMEEFTSNLQASGMVGKVVWDYTPQDEGNNFDSSDSE
jgi:GH25 family lysozyme M1 (1,4-beta-N-acetylmuramidase)